MNQRQIILLAWERRKKNRTPSPQLQKAQAFFDLLNEQNDLCWPELVGEFRRNYYDAFDEIVPTLLSTDDPLIIYNCLQVVDPDNAKEAEVTKKIIRDCDPGKHEVSILTLAKNPELHSTLRQKGKLPESVRATMANVTLPKVRPPKKPK